MINLQHKDVWNGTHGNLHVEIVRFKFGISADEKDRWCYYVSFPLELVKEEICFDANGKLTTDTSWYTGVKNESPLTKLNWHGGITYCEIKGKYAKIGCDFQHYQDEGRVYTLENVKMELERTVSAFLSSSLNKKI